MQLWDRNTTSDHGLAQIIWRGMWQLALAIALSLVGASFLSAILTDSRLLLEKGGGKYQLNLWEANVCVFQEAGIKKERILMPGICTCCNPDFLFSHRASQGKRGNLAAFLGIHGRNA